MKKLWIIIFFAANLYACQYNVRDMGFVDMGDSYYRFYVFLDAANANHQQNLSADLSLYLADSNVLPEVHIGLPNVTVSKPARLPAVVVVHPQGRELILPLYNNDQSLTGQLQLLTQRLATSPLKRELTGKATENFAVVLFLKSLDDSADAKASNTIETSLEYLKQQMIFMPKLVSNPPLMMTVDDPDEILLWELNLSKLTEPAAAIIYGRTRLIGPVFVGSNITEKNLNAYLAVIGADCECGLDRRLLHPPMLAHNWDRLLYQRATENLGFDPEHPQVKMEIGQIINNQRPDSTGQAAVPDISFGYQEFIIDEVLSPNAANEPELPIIPQSTTVKKPIPQAQPIEADSKVLLYILLAAAVVIAIGLIIVGRSR